MNNAFHIIFDRIQIYIYGIVYIESMEKTENLSSEILKAIWVKRETKEQFLKCGFAGESHDTVLQRLLAHYVKTGRKTTEGIDKNGKISKDGGTRR